MTPYNHDAEFNLGNVPDGDDRGQQGADTALGLGLGLVDFTLVPHLDHEDFLPEHSLAGIQEWAAGVPVPTYAIDDQTAIRVTGGAVEVISEGHWKIFAPRLRPAGRPPLPSARRASGVHSNAGSAARGRHY